jgi:hypothetical protein
MPLRSPEIVGMVDPRDITGPVRPRTTPAAAPRSNDEPTSKLTSPTPDVGEPREPAAPSRPAVPKRRPATPPTPPVAGATVRATPEPGAGTTIGPEEERVFVQILVPPELTVRVGRASHYLKTEVPKARFQQTIMGALIERSIPAPNDPWVIAAMAGLIARWRQDPLSERRASRRLGWHLPLPISARLDQLLLNLKEQHYRIRPSATSLLAALIWLELDPDTTEGQVALKELVVPYHDKWERPDYESLAA